MDSTLCASADPGNFLVHADANQQSRYKPLTEATYTLLVHASYTVHQAVIALAKLVIGMQCSVAEISAGALQEMNPLVKVTVQRGCLGVTDMSFLDSYQVSAIAPLCLSAISLSSCRPARALLPFLAVQLHVWLSTTSRSAPSLYFLEGSIHEMPEHTNLTGLCTVASPVTAKQTYMIVPGFHSALGALTSHAVRVLSSVACFLQVVLLVDHSLAQQQAWDSACTARGIAFYSAASGGTCAYLFANLHQHTYTPLVSGSVRIPFWSCLGTNACCCTVEGSCLPVPY